jgi:hypothetical protein
MVSVSKRNISFAKVPDMPRDLCTASLYGVFAP